MPSCWRSATKPRLTLPRCSKWRSWLSIGPLRVLAWWASSNPASALRQRIERLVNFHAPRKAGLTFVSLCGVCIFSAVALPMGKAAVSAGNQPVSQVDASDQNLTVKVKPEVFIKNVKAEAATYMHAPTDDYTDILLDILRGEGVDCVSPAWPRLQYQNRRNYDAKHPGSPGNFPPGHRAIESSGRKVCSPDGIFIVPSEKCRDHGAILQDCGLPTLTIWFKG